MMSVHEKRPLATSEGPQSVEKRREKRHVEVVSLDAPVG